MKAKLGLAAIATAVAAVIVAALSGCSPTVSLLPAAHDATNPACATVIANLELFTPTVSGMSPRITDTQSTAAWGTPTPCVTVNGIDWLRKADKDDVYVFTTCGRDPAISVQVDSSNVKADGNQALTDVANAVGTIPQKHKCVAPIAVLQDGEPVNTPTSTPTPSPTPTPTATTKP
jgi:hypothetical protein